MTTQGAFRDLAASHCALEGTTSSRPLRPRPPRRPPLRQEHPPSAELPLRLAPEGPSGNATSSIGRSARAAPGPPPSPPPHSSRARCVRHRVGVTQRGDRPSGASAQPCPPRHRGHSLVPPRRLTNTNRGSPPPQVEPSVPACCREFVISPVSRHRLSPAPPRRSATKHSRT